MSAITDADARAEGVAGHRDDFLRVIGGDIFLRDDDGFLFRFHENSVGQQPHAQHHSQKQTYDFFST